jgi:1-acyl-sn-glycerol-3-phosphate acyltransferase
MRYIQFIWYYFFWSLVKIGLRLFFSKIQLTGLKKIPKNAAVIFGSNHENAFLDALILTTSTFNFDHYLVRADVFNNKIAKAILNSWNLMPVYRMSDGINSLKDNSKIFEACHKALAKKYSVMIFPEAAHELRRMKRKVKKGIARIALGAVNYPGGTEELYIMPVGVNYSDHSGFRSSVHLMFGEPILVTRQEESKENIEKLRTRVDEEMSKCYISFDRTHQEAIDTVLLHDVGLQEVLDPVALNKQAEKLLLKIEEAEEIVSDKKELASRGIKFPFVLAKWTDFMKVLLLAPLALIGLILNSPALLPLFLFVNLKVKDRAFVASMKLGLGLLTFGIWWWNLASWVYTQTGGQWTLVLITILIAILSLVSINAFVRAWRIIAMTRLLKKKDLYSKYLSFVQKAKRLRGY